MGSGFLRLSCVGLLALWEVWQSSTVGGVPKGVSEELKTFRSREMGFTIRYPATMSLHTGEHAAYQGYIRWNPKPDVRIALPALSFVGTHIQEADVAILASEEGLCPDRLPSGPETQVIGGRRFSHSRNGDGATGHYLTADSFATMHRGKCFVIMAVVQGYRYDEERTELEVKRTEKRESQIKAKLMSVIESLKLTDPGPTDRVPE